MTPTSFPEQNIIFNPPEGMEERCDPLPAFRGEGQVISCWRLTFWLGVHCPFIRNRRR